MKQAPIWIAIAVALGSGLFGLDRLALWMESRGWLYYRKTKHRPSGALGNAFLEIQAMVDPPKRHVLEQKRRQRREAAESGDPPQTGKRTSRAEEG